MTPIFGCVLTSLFNSACRLSFLRLENHFKLFIPATQLWGCSPGRCTGQPVPDQKRWSLLHFKANLRQLLKAVSAWFRT